MPYCNFYLTFGAHVPEGYDSCRVCVCVCVCLLSHIVRLELLFIVKTLQCTQWATKVSETALLPRSSDPSLGQPYIGSAIFPVDNMHAHCAYASFPRFGMDAPCHKLSLHPSFMMMESSN